MELYALAQIKETVASITPWTIYTVYIYRLERCGDRNLYWIIDSAYYSAGGSLYASPAPFVASHLKEIEPGMPYLGIVENRLDIPFKHEHLT